MIDRCNCFPTLLLVNKREQTVTKTVVTTTRQLLWS